MAIVFASLLVPDNAVAHQEYYPEEMISVSAQNAPIITPIGRDESAAGTSTSEIKSTDDCFCVRFAKKLGLNIPAGVNAEDIKPNSRPVLNGGILFYYPSKKIHHIGVIKEFRGDGFLIEEANFKKCEKGKRIVSYSDPFIIGFTERDNIELWTSIK